MARTGVATARSFLVYVFLIALGGTTAVHGQSLHLQPPILTLPLEGTATLQAEALGLADPSVTWALVSGGGTVDPDSGLYAAPDTMPADGRAVIRVTATADPSCSGYVTVWLSPLLSLGGVGEPVPVPGHTDILRIADMDGDGRLDLVRRSALHAGTGVVDGLNIMLCTDEGWVSHASLMDDRLAAFAVGDIDLDDTPDVIAILVERDGDLVSSRVQVFLNDGNGGLTAYAESAATPGLLSQPRVADLNGDGLVDLAVSRTGASGEPDTAGVIYGDSSTVFDPVSSLVGALDHGGAAGLEIVDLNGDGLPDLVAGNGSGSELSVAFSGGDRHRAVSVTYEIGEQPSAAAGDFTGDGWADLAVTTAAGDLYLLTNPADGSGDFSLSGPLPGLPASIRHLQAAHLDSDAHLDLVALEGNTATAVLRGTGTGQFGGPVWLCYGSLFGLGLGDFDGDGRPDLVGACVNTHTTHILPGLETGSPDFNVYPPTATVNLERSTVFSWLALNPTTAPPGGGQVHWSAGPDLLGTVVYEAPAAMPEEAAVTVSVTRDDTGESATAAVTLTDIAFRFGLPSGQAVWSVLPDPTDPARLYVGADAGLVYRSAGATSAERLGGVLGTNAIDELALTQGPDNTPILLARTGGSLFRYPLETGTGGEWQESIIGRTVTAVQAAPGQGRVYALANDGSLHRSDDAAVTWAAVVLAPWMGSLRGLWLVPETGELYVGYLSGDLYRLAWSADGGTAWEDRSAGLGNQIRPVADLTWNPGDPNLMMLCLTQGSLFHDGMVFRSTDGGGSWEPVSGLPLTRKGRALAAALSGPGTVYAMGDTDTEQYCVFRSDDWGGSWWDISSGLPTGFRTALATSALGAEFVYAGTAGGLFATAFPSGTDYAATPGVSIATSSPNLALGSTVTLVATVPGLDDPGVTWSVVSGGGTVDPESGAYTAPDTMPAGGQAVVRAVSTADPARSGLVTVRLAPLQALGAVAAPTSVPGRTEIGRAVDMNGDGRPDLVRRTSVRDDGGVVTGLSVVLNREHGWLPHWSGSAGDLFAFAVHDLDRDGDPDVLAVHVEFVNGHPYSALQVFVNDGTGALAAQARSARAPGMLANPVVADFNGDTRMDLAVSRTRAPGAQDAVGVVYSDGGQVFDPVFRFVSVLDHGADSGLEAVDLTGDGRPDLVAADLSNGDLSVVVNAGGGAWHAPVTYEPGVEPRPAVGDFSGDGWADIAVTTADGALRVLVNAGDGTGSLSMSGPVAEIPEAMRRLRAAHVNGDAHLDLVALDGNSAAAMLRGTGDGGFGPPVWLFYGSVFGLELADFTGDGRLDVLGTGVNTDSTHVFPGLETGDYGFRVIPGSGSVNLGRSARFSRLALNPTTPPPAPDQVNWNAGADSLGTVIYHAPEFLPAPPEATVTATRTDTGETATAAVTLTQIAFRNALPAGEAVWSVVCPATAPGTLYVGADAGRVYRSAGGTTAELLGVAVSGNAVTGLGLALDETGGDLLLACDRVGLFRYALDSGTGGTWQECGAPGWTVSFAAVPGTATVYSVQADGDLYRSTNAGLDWNAVGLPAWADRAVGVWAVDTALIYLDCVVGTAHRPARSPDGGGTWEDCSAGLGPHAGQIVGLVWDPQEPQTLMLAFRRGDLSHGDLVFRSTDGGLLWQPVLDLPLTRTGRALAAAPGGHGTFYAMGDTDTDEYCVFRSDDRGLSWWDITTGLPTGFRACLAGSVLGPEYAYVGTAGGLFATAFPSAEGFVGTPALTIEGSTLNLALGASTVFSAEATGLDDTRVAWSLVEGGGSIDPETGVYTAPDTMPAGRRAVVRATSVADPSRSGYVTVWLSPLLSLGGVGDPVAVPGRSDIVRAADMNGDGTPDLIRRTSLVEGAGVVNGLNILLNTDRGWVSHWSAAADDLFQFAVHDLDGDGDLDVLAVLRTSVNSNPWSALQVFRNAGDGRLSAQPRSEPTAGLLTSPILIDLNGDGRVDLAASRTRAQGLQDAVGVIYSDGQGVFDPAFRFVSVLDHGAGAGLTTADLDGDGRPDLVAGDAVNPLLSVVLNAGGGAWREPVAYNVGTEPCPAVGDFTGDGWADVAVTTADGTLSLLANAADGTGALSLSDPLLHLPAGARRLTPAHLDNDTDLDLVSLDGNSATAMLKGMGDGRFEGPAWLAYGAIYGLDIADFDGDDLPDIVGAGVNTSSTHILSGLQTGYERFAVYPAAAIVTLGRSTQLSRLSLNPSTPPPASGQVTWSAGEDLVGTVTYKAPVTMPADPDVSVRVRRTDTGETAAATVTLVDVSFHAAEPSGVGVRCVLEDPESPGTLYVGADRGRVYRSIGGSVAEALGNAVSGNAVTGLALTRDGAGGRILLASDHAGLFRYALETGTAGTWVVCGPPGWTYAAAAVPASGDVYAVQADGSLYRSEDATLSWTQLQLPPWVDSACGVWCLSAAELYLDCLSGGVHRLAYSPDHGVSWYDRSAGLGDHAQPITSVVRAYADPDLMMLCFTRGTLLDDDLVFRSDNGGQQWHPVLDLPLTRTGRALATANAALGSVYALGDTDSEQYTVFRSDDWGTSWWDMTRGLPAGLRSTLAVSALGPDHVHVGAAAGLFATVVSHPVTFVVGDYGIHSGGGDLFQIVDHGEPATPPEIEPATGWTFDAWDRLFDEVTAPLTVRALYDDGDSLPDGWEQQIADADPGDDLLTAADVRPEQDFDGDGEDNATEYTNGTDPTDARSTHDPARAYTDFRFGIHRVADQTETGAMTEAVYCTELACGMPPDRRFASGLLWKPPAAEGRGDNPVALVGTQTGGAEHRSAEYATLEALCTDFPAGDYRVHLTLAIDNGATGDLRFRVALPACTEADFPAYVTVTNPLPGADQVPVTPEIRLDTEGWDRLEIVDPAGGPVYAHTRTPDETLAHQVPGEAGLARSTTYSLRVDRWGPGDARLASRTRLPFTTEGAAQTLEFEPLPQGIVHGTPPFVVRATASSGLPVTLTSSDEAVAAVSREDGAWVLSIRGTGSTTVTASQPGDADWAAAPPVSQVLTVDRRQLTATAEDADRLYGRENPPLTVNCSGFAPGEDESDLDSLPVAACAATALSNAGTYPITVSGGAARNYTFLYVEGTLTVVAGVALDLWLENADGSLRIDLQAGEAETATAGFDPRWDLLAGPVTGETVAAYLIDPFATSASGQGLLRDFRPCAERTHWRLVITADPGAVPLTLRWDVATAAPEREVFLQPLRGERPVAFPVPLRNSTSLEVTATGEYDLVYGVRENLALNLEAGWNLVGNPMLSLQTSVDVLDDGTRAPLHWGPVWRWEDSSYRTLDPAGPLTPEEGFWIYCLKPGQSAAVSGVRTDGLVVLSPGTNLVSPAVDCVLRETEVKGWYWDAGRKVHVPVEAGDRLEAGRAYWFYLPASEPLPLDLGR